MIGDEGSGMKLGMEGLSAAGLSWDGGKHTILCKLLDEHHGISDGSSMVKAVYDAGFQPSRVAIQVIEAANAGDEVCTEICERQSRLIAAQVEIVALKLPSDSRRIVLWGGLQKNDYYRSLMQHAIEDIVDGVHFTVPAYEPWVGAALMAKNRA